VSAEAIIAARRPAKRVSVVLRGVILWAMIAAAVWYGARGGSAALALLIVLAVMTLIGVLGTDLHRTHTFVMIAERRAQLIEHQLAALQRDLALGARAAPDSFSSWRAP
jgi:hypothetical protein